MTKDNIFRECRKLMDILNTYGNTIVPSIPGQKETSARKRLNWIINLAVEEHNMDLDDLEEGIKNL